ncbi:MAG: glycosyltransferase, partial [Planctomycetota bacterium]|nr:glycosyltransferase [Planctomycetota bacterium]
MPRVSIVTATHGRPAELRQAIESALAQDFEDFEHLVIDDASPDDSAAQVVAELGDPRLRVIRLESSRGAAGARNAGLAEARGQLLAILDDDDWMLPGRLTATARAFDEDDTLVLVGAPWLAVDEDGREQATVWPERDPEKLR